MLLFTPFSATRFAMHRIYASRINSRGMSRVFCDLRSPKTPRGILPVNSNVKFICYSSVFFSFKHICFLSQHYLKKIPYINKANVPTTISINPAPDFNDSFSWNTTYENAIVTRILSLSMGTTTLAGPV